MKKSIAILGGGVAGITAAYYLQNQFDITIFEKEKKIGGHTNTIEINDNSGLAIDTGFIVLNDKNYPNLHKMLKDLEVPVRYSNMSFSFYSELDKFCYSGDTLCSLFADRRNLIRPKFYAFLYEITKFSKQALADLKTGINSSVSMHEYLNRYNYSSQLVEKYLLPMGSAIWSTSSKEMLKFPAQALLAFFKNHGLLSLQNRPRWQTVCGGSHSYIKKFQNVFNGQILNNEEVQAIEYQNNKYSVKTKNTKLDFDIVISALHANLVNQILPPQKESLHSIFSKWDYNLNHTVLHTDVSVMPKIQRAWASWNYLETNHNQSNKLYTTYYMNLLMGIKSETNYFVTLNCPFRINPEKIIYETHYEHPLYTTESLATQSIIKSLNGQNNLWFCGSYLGNGFHEDAVTSALAVVQELRK